MIYSHANSNALTRIKSPPDRLIVIPVIKKENNNHIEKDKKV